MRCRIEGLISLVLFGMMIPAANWLAYGSLEFLAGQIVGKTRTIIVSMLFVMWLSSRDERVAFAPA